MDGAHGFGRRIVHVDCVAKANDCGNHLFVQPCICEFVSDVLHEGPGFRNITTINQYGCNVEGAQARLLDHPCRGKSTSCVVQEREPPGDLTTGDHDQASSARCSRYLSREAEIGEFRDRFGKVNVCLYVVAKVCCAVSEVVVNACLDFQICGRVLKQILVNVVDVVVFGCFVKRIRFRERSLLEAPHVVMLSKDQPALCQDRVCLIEASGLR